MFIRNYGIKKEVNPRGLRILSTNVPTPVRELSLSPSQVNLFFTV